METDLILKTTGKGEPLEVFVCIVIVFFTR